MSGIHLMLAAGDSSLRAIGSLSSAASGPQRGYSISSGFGMKTLSVDALRGFDITALMDDGAGSFAVQIRGPRSLPRTAFRAITINGITYTTASAGGFSVYVPSNYSMNWTWGNPAGLQAAVSYPFSLA